MEEAMKPIVSNCWPWSPRFGIHSNQRKPFPFVLILFGALLLFAAQGVSPPPAQAATVTVVNTSDSGAGSLRQAIADANAGDIIAFSLAYPATITLTGGHLAIDKDLTINGPGASDLKISGNNSSRVITVAVGVTTSITGLSIADGYAAIDDVGGVGGGIYNQGTLNISSSDFSNNSASAPGTAGGGGGISNFGTLTVLGTNFHGNYAEGMGGAIYNGATTTVTNCAFTGNSVNLAGAGGGAIANYWGGILDVINSTFSGNLSSSGGALFSGYNAAILSVTNSTFINNTTSHQAQVGAQASGGGVSIGDQSTATITNTTFIGNSASAAGDYHSASGGGLRNGGTLDLVNCTFSGNSVISTGTVMASAIGGGLMNTGTLTLRNCTCSGNSASGITAYPGFFSSIGGGTATFINSIVANSIGGPNCGGQALGAASTNNLATDSSCTTGFTQVTPAQLRLDALTGSPAYFPLQPGSAAIDSGTNDQCPTSDQRGLPRPQDGDMDGAATCDVGSYEALPLTNKLLLPLIMR
jgi:hypothetical protein